jgi:zona occludens toxin (predicted ATPase)
MHYSNDNDDHDDESEQRRYQCIITVISRKKIKAYVENSTYSRLTLKKKDAYVFEDTMNVYFVEQMGRIVEALFRDEDVYKVIPEFKLKE